MERDRDDEMPDIFSVDGREFAQRECPICYDPIAEKAAVWISQDVYCTECAKPYLTNKIQDAIKNEIYYPIREGTEDIPLESYLWLIDDEALVRMYYNRGLDYEVPAPKRKYCKHKIRAGDRPEDPYFYDNPKTWIPPVALGVETETCGFQMREMTQNLFHCSSCAGLTCALCSEPIYGVHVDHYCPMVEDGEEEGDPFAGQVRGKDYQLCPDEDCQMPVSLSEACNHMTCARPSCRTEFCFVCGEPAKEGEGHWGRYDDQCPLYGQPGAPGTRPGRRGLQRPNLAPWMHRWEEREALWQERMDAQIDRIVRNERFERW
ncbi:hypothetical protein AC578_6513 [Pseudocercospora eumusae]|uniref:RBR-type E3 ubiquitin transferase n=1 Tax=Pseudocercospora eumusae TaxID=321146 RepID=A0A139HHW5_9PEZI|nr:hypothetical protein AC578_6513 [Pseudocercospora eumusae]